ncbi:type IV toxin-antitoxin system AbiEi family antitoxin domain-containing protein [Stenotrophomonas sp. YAU14A_MKIMI4_1]|uniref:type IV toxin-antitoxin system AbiEi family antitoxin domain-containing protein n=1 Tax=Stenotrophomonas sp. YAU14A_MKIMI4_1 TaxID=2072408 RepID=UPI000D5406F8|nr:type IV toxin-antitoxin system AbiEi family antitoxin domain-containing protein [Stenotrophomonas sp. YAU14A_MKIMI4_1]AWH28048.1 transcriptional regulator [Stenotrophomonas sp. YAU14A_MKIMI4_1]
MMDPLALAKALIQRTGAARSRDLVRAGVARTQLSRLVARGDLQRLSRGVYVLPDQGSVEGQDGLQVVAARSASPRLCLLSALRQHGLTTQNPFEVWIAIGNKDRAPRIDWPPLRVVRMSEKTLEAGLEPLPAGPRSMRTTCVAKTVADCFKYRNLVGMDVAIEALRDALREGATTADELWLYARLCRVARLMRPYLEALA